MFFLGAGVYIKSWVSIRDPPPELTASNCQQCGQYATYWNAFLLPTQTVADPSFPIRECQPRGDGTQPII